jgi:hypothetical protein
MSSSEKNDLSPPQASAVDARHAKTKGLISAVPYLGGVAAELFDLVIAPPLAKRRDEWMNVVAQKITELEQKQPGFKIEDLAGNQLFLTVVMQSTIAALRNHQKEKLEALQNAVVNTARGIDIDESLQLLFLDMVDSLTPLHLKIFGYFADPTKFFTDPHRFDLGGAPSQALEEAFRELRGQREIYDPIVQDLFNRNLLNTDRNGLHGMMSTGTLAPRTTELGKKFLRYIGPS